MRGSLSIFYRQSTRLIFILLLLIGLGVIRWFFDGSLTFYQSKIPPKIFSSIGVQQDPVFLYRRQNCSCTRPIFGPKTARVIIEESSVSLCNQYSTFRGFHQKIIAISMYGPRENALFNVNVSLNFLHELIADMTTIYPDWILRIYHDATIQNDIICPVECAHHRVDFCDTDALPNLGNLTSYVPPKIWRFLPAGDPLVDITASRDLDSPLAQRELDAVNEWLSANKSWHVMRDHPFHAVPILGGMWGFRPALNRTFARDVLNKILNQSLITRYGGRGDQTFLGEHIWPYIQNDVIAHDSYLCTTGYGKNSQPWPSRRPPLNVTGCFVGCVRPCCPLNKFPLGECPLACRPKNHPDWTMC